MDPDDRENSSSKHSSLKTMFLAQAKARTANDKPAKKRPAKKHPSTAVESNAPSVTENERERDSALEIESSAKQRERDSAREMKLPASDALQSDVQPVKKQGYLICQHGLQTFIIFGSETL